ncbi:MAG TPA: pyridoxamine 5'-phosphate oxidase family protein [Verrucomicrobiae bacterium]|nr:pyridoxamine 5'-phosphate oxidase family protein [Verrucomicrobiae bacterium]
MNNEEVEQIIRGYIPQVIHMSLATSKDNKPWVCEVHFAYDEALNLYFVSSKNRRHSQEIAVNPFVAGNIVTQHHKQQKVRGVYFEGEAKRLENVGEDHSGYRAYIDRLGGREGMLKEISQDGATGLYQITVSSFYLFDSYVSGRDKYQLSWGAKP